ncbi:hypothetical protein [Mammaliicoccus lentus]|uniref:hypothetical protein n=1 Tax=Mammaliicoccus lentus TaxID=42858 RepID=UPI001430E7C8|nr:hypothetical protein [Mammaliicoccus lentus]MBF0795203.1 hypothetical protein [Mammaliicoccus lentus]
MDKHTKIPNEKLEEMQTVMVALENLITDEEIRQSEIFEDYQDVINQVDDMLKV